LTTSSSQKFSPHIWGIKFLCNTHIHLQAYSVTTQKTISRHTRQWKLQINFTYPQSIFSVRQKE
jgi:hypothetical protein